jgi:phosphoesterase RecJ-like protein
LNDSDICSRVLETLMRFPSWTLLSHMKPDGDTIGAASALFEAGVKSGRKPRWIGPDSLPPAYLFLSHTGAYETVKEYSFLDGLCVFVDCANERRSVVGFPPAEGGAFALNIDHHEDNTLYGTMNCVVPSASSTSEIVWRVLSASPELLTPEAARSLYTGITADTGGFAFSNTGVTTHLAAADLIEKGAKPAEIDAALKQNRTLAGTRLWGAAMSRVVTWGSSTMPCGDGRTAPFAMSWLTREDFKERGAEAHDTDSLVNQLLMIRGVTFAVLLSEGGDGSPDNGGHEIRVSLRSRSGSFPCAPVARELGGGGHPCASGTLMHMPMEDAIRTVRETVDRLYAEWTEQGRL